ncbi:hypothetical protein OEG86_06150 [Hoeflea alexandrii]|uniref:hypothetical protein n=1 Tax=Hoeflea alexandrii TaxID=288436 RepID=UPI00226F1235|nr:hypothetical protein [Hoeflea alexandrii]MCY0151902.1 hypothetical protein [Hoeflea alexandrii]
MPFGIGSQNGLALARQLSIGRQIVAGTDQIDELRPEGLSRGLFFAGRACGSACCASEDNGCRAKEAGRNP